MFEMAKIYLSVIIPCYNEGPTFEKSVEKIINVLNKLKKSWEIIFVEDKGVDETRNSINGLNKKIKNSKSIFHTRNKGRGRSVADGILIAKGDICGYLDVDLEVSADYIKVFVSEIERGADLAVGKRFYESNFKSLSRVILSKVYAFIVKTFLKIPIADTEAGYKFFRRKRILPILVKVKSNHWFWDTEICARTYWSGLNVSEVPVMFIRRTDKKSTVKLLSDTIAYIKEIMRFRGEVPENNN